MTNEKDREEAESILKELGLLYDADCIVDTIARIRSEAVQAERDRCTNAIENCRAKLGSFKNGAYTDVWNTAIEEAKKSILSTDQGTAEKESNRG